MIELLKNAQLNWRKEKLNRGEYLIRTGERAHYFYLVESGALRAVQEVEEQEYTIRLAYKNSVIAPLPAFFNGSPSHIDIQAIRQSEVLCCSKQELDEHFLRDVTSAKTYVRLLEELVSSFYEREIDLLTHSTAERLKRILERSPQVFQEVPHKYIAAYLSMSPETLSRLLNS